MREHLGQIIRHIMIALCLAAGALAVVSHVHDHDMELVRQPLGDDTPISRRSKKPMCNKKGRGARIPIGDVIQHVFAVSGLAGLGKRRLGRIRALGMSSVKVHNEMEPAEIQALVARVFALLESRLGARGATLKKRLDYVRRKLPGRVRRAGDLLVDAQKMADNPRLAMRVDRDGLTRATVEIERFLNAIDVPAERSRRRYNRLAAFAGQFLLVFGALVGLLVWRGYI